MSNSILPKSVSDVVTVTVPATTANIGPGFDCLGAALTLYNRFRFAPLAAGTVEIQVCGSEAARVTADPNNLAYRAFATVFERQQQPVPPVRLTIELGVPLARGLGSSSTAIVGGLLGAQQFSQVPLSQAALIALATELEGHPDNVVPALIGGCQLAAGDGAKWTLSDVPWHPQIVPVVAIPDFELSTEAARQVLPTAYSRADAIFNMAHLGLLLRGLATGTPEWLAAALSDRLHQPYRQSLILGYDAVRCAALDAGAYGLVISGAGPTLLALTHQSHAAQVAAAMAAAWSPLTSVTTHCLQLDTAGAQVTGA